MASKKRPLTENTDPNVARGTVAELVKGKNAITFNGKKLDQPTLSALTRVGIAKAVGTAPRPAGTRGPAPTVWELPLNGTFAVARK